MRYERCGELPYVLSSLKPLFSKKANHLDIGTGDSIMPSYLLKNTNWDITCIDKCGWMKMQTHFAKKAVGKVDYIARLRLVQKDFLTADLPENHYDVITIISVIEHFEGQSDSEAMEKVGRLLKPGGVCILTTPINEGHYKEFYVQQSVYGEQYNRKPVFFQRHYDIQSFQERIIKTSRLKEKERMYVGDYGFQFKEIFLDPPVVLKPLKILYQWAIPCFARKFLSYRETPVSRKNMKIYTASAVMITLVK